MITLYALEQSRAYRIAWLLEILGVDYQADMISRDPDSHLAPASLQSIHPLGRSPIIRDDELVLAESGAIVEYLIARYGQGRNLRPDCNDARFADYLYWLHYAEGSLMPLLVMSLVFRKIDESKMPFFAKPIARAITTRIRKSYLHPQLERNLLFVDKQLDGKTWFLGEQLSGADVMMGFPLQAALTRTALHLPNVAAYVHSVENHEAYRRVEARLGKLELL